MSNDKISFTNEETLAKYDRLDCPVLASNSKKLAFEFESHPELISALSTADPAGIVKTLEKLYSQDSKFLDLYKDLAPQMQIMFRLSGEKVEEILPILEGLAVFYIANASAATIRSVISKSHSGLVDLTKKLKSITDEVDENLDNFILFLNIMTFNPDESNRYKSAFDDLLHANKKLQTLPEYLKNSQFAKIVEFDKPARATNWGLQFWTEHLFFIWMGFLERGIKNRNDGINGRKHLLDFLEFCMAPIHEAVEFETLDNMLRKVQKDIKARAELSPSDFEVGGSSPFRVKWSNSES